MPRFCPTCEKLLQFENAEICPNCGFRFNSPINAPPRQNEGRKLSLYLIIGIVLILIIAAVVYYSVLGAGFFSTQKVSPSTPSDSSSVSLSTQITHVPSEIIQGHLNLSEKQFITTMLRDPQTSRYTVKLIGPENTDFDLYVQKEGSPDNYIYNSSKSGSNEQVDIINPTIGNYTIMAKSYRGAGDFVLYIDYAYNNNN